MRPSITCLRPLLLAAGLLEATLVGSACHPPPARFPFAPTVWDDPDRNHVPGPLRERFTGTYADGIDRTLLRPASELLAVRRTGEARNVNALDEVPNSSWFTNRIGVRPFTPEELARGSCDGPPLQASTGSWILTGAKPDGVTPGFFIKSSTGQRYLIKLGGRRGVAADVIGSRIYHAAGYNAPCNDVVVFARDRIRVAPTATVRDALGRKQPFSEADLDRVLATVPRRADGRFLAVASQFIPGQPIGSFRYEGVRRDDPNDVVPHEDRRELRAARLLAAWIGRFDTRDQNSFDTVVVEGGRRFVRHYQLDFGDALGLIADDPFAFRMNHSYFLDLQHILVDLLSFGAVRRPWHRPPPAWIAGTLASFRAGDFDPLRWRPIYPNPAFSRMTWRDALWMVRILVRFSDAHLRALVDTARLEDPAEARHLLAVLIERRDRIVRAYLAQGVPLGRVAIVGPPAQGQRLCFEDLGIAHGGVRHQTVTYQVVLLAGRRLHRTLGTSAFRPAAEHPDVSCVALPPGELRPAPAAPRVPGDLRTYAVAQILVQHGEQPPRTRVDVHLYDGGPEAGFTLVGIERVRRDDSSSLQKE